MINRWQIDSNILDLVVSILGAVNPIDPAYINAPIPKYKYNIVRGRKVRECESNDLQLYCATDATFEGEDSNCMFYTDLDVIIGIIRRKDYLVPDFETLKSAITYLFGNNSLQFTYPTLTVNGITYTDARVGDVGVSGIGLRSSAKQEDKCGVFNYEILIRFRLYFNR